MLKSQLVPDVPSIAALKVKIFADGADKNGMLAMLEKPYIKGFTTNPTLMRKSGVENYEAFARDVLAAITKHPISFEVFADDELEMERQGREIAAWGSNVYVKIPVTNTRGVSTAPLVRRLSADGIKLNVTAMMTVEQVSEICTALRGGAPACVSVFAGRIADTGRDPIPLMRDALEVISQHPTVELIWASPRELLNIFQADAIGCHIITVTNDVLAKLGGVGKDLCEFSLETVRMFFDDARSASLSI
jgi:transaldolase